jgi:protein-S-isoprenylcysteine O-methyltransferase Ste14
MKRTTIGWTLVVLQFVLLVVLVLLPRRPPLPLPVVVGGLLVAAGVVLGLAAGRRLGAALTPTPVPITGAGLRTSGAYRYVRHPIYSAVLLAVLGYVIALGSGWGWAWAALIGVFFLVKSRWEDRLLHAEYGDEWAEWAARTGAIVPRIGSR